MAIARNKPEDIPPALKNKPEPDKWALIYWDAYNKLASSRQWTMGGPAAIAFSEIKAYFDLYQITDLDEVDEYLFVIQKLDAFYLDYSAKKRDKT